MKSYRTTRCSRFGHQEFHLRYADEKVLVDDVAWFADTLEGLVAGGTRYRAGETFQIGCLLTRIEDTADGALSLFEPDLKSFPIVWLEGITNSLCLLRLQKDVVESLLPQECLTFPSLLESCVACTRLGLPEGIVMARESPAGGDSGWFVGCTCDDHDHGDPANLRRMSLYETVVRDEPRALPYLALPAGILLRVGTGVPLFFLNEERLEVRNGSYLHMAFERIWPRN